MGKLGVSCCLLTAFLCIVLKAQENIEFTFDDERVWTSRIGKKVNAKLTFVGGDSIFCNENIQGRWKYKKPDLTEGKQIILSHEKYNIHLEIVFVKGVVKSFNILQKNNGKVTN